jgi:dephospho-CoA kinase
VRAVTRVIAVTGGIGTGKTTVTRLLAAAGAVVIDADAIVHELQAPGSPLLAEIATAFGPEILDANGALDRARLADRVFRDPADRLRLNALVHPRVGAEMARRSQEARSAGASLIVLDIPLLFETRPRDRDAARGGNDATVLVYAPRAVQIERTVARDRCTRAEAERRVAAQLPIDDKRALADYVIDNGGALTDTERQVRDLVAKLAGAPAGGTTR